MATLLAEFYTRFSPTNVLKCPPNLMGLLVLCSAHKDFVASLRESDVYKGSHHKPQQQQQQQQRRHGRRRHKRRVHFAETVSLIDVVPKESGTDATTDECWLSAHELHQPRQADLELIEMNVHVQNYLRSCDIAYLDIVLHRRRQHNGDSPRNRQVQSGSTSPEVQQVLLQAVGAGYRSLERFSCQSRKRIQASRRTVHLVVAKFRELKVSNTKPSLFLSASSETQLSRYAQLLSQNDVRWAQFLGEVDASVVAFE